MVLLKLLLAFMKIGAFSFGGGYAVVTLMQKELIDTNGWMSVKDFADIVGISGITPGPIAANASAFVGYKMAGVLGAAVSITAVILIPVIISLLVSIFFNKFKHIKQVNWVLKGIRPAVLGLIGAACYNIGKVSFIDIKSVIIGVIIFAGVYKFKINPILAILISAVLGVIMFGVL